MTGVIDTNRLIICIECKLFSVIRIAALPVCLEQSRAIENIAMIRNGERSIRTIAARSYLLTESARSIHCISISLFADANRFQCLMGTGERTRLQITHLDSREVEHTGISCSCFFPSGRHRNSVTDSARSLSNGNSKCPVLITTHISCICGQYCFFSIDDDASFLSLSIGTQLHRTKLQVVIRSIST